MATLEEIKKLREVSGAGMMDCKKALEESKGDMDKAIECLRKKGAAVAAKRAEREAKEGVIAIYSHGGRLGAMVEVNCETDFVAKNEGFKAFAQEIAMQIAGANPLYVSREEVPAEVVEKEKEIETEKLKAEGKPENIIEKILEGKLDKFYGEVCLLEQAYIKDPDLKVQSLIDEQVAKIGEKIQISRFARFAVGEK
jgi:elongation factor Ts